MSRKPLIALLLLTVISTSASSQVSRLPQARQYSGDQEKPPEKKDLRLPTRKSVFDIEKMDFQLERVAQFQLDLQTQPLEKPVDAKTYHVGPGDRFIVTIWSTTENSFPAHITPEGKLMIPTIGSLDVNGMTLFEAQQLVKKEAGKKYLNSQVSVDLAGVRGIRVHVTGQVLNPGTYSVLAVHRVADAIELAGGLTSWAFEREIQVRHADGTLDAIDLYQYKKLGMIDANIYLNGGDVVHIPSINLNNPTVRIEGALNDPGVYELKAGETLKDFLLRVDALSRRAELRYAFIERERGSDNQQEVVPVFKYLEQRANGHADLILQDGDVINVPQRHEDVYVTGAVRNPGAYPYIPTYSAHDYIGLAGSTENAGNPNRTRVFRRGEEEKEKGRNVPVEPGDVVFVPRRVEFGIREMLSVVTTVTNILLTMKALDVL